MTELLVNFERLTKLLPFTDGAHTANESQSFLLCDYRILEENKY